MAHASSLSPVILASAHKSFRFSLHNANYFLAFSNQMTENEINSDILMLPSVNRIWEAKKFKKNWINWSLKKQVISSYVCVYALCFSSDSQCIILYFYTRHTRTYTVYRLFADGLALMFYIHIVSTKAIVKCISHFLIENIGFQRCTLYGEIENMSNQHASCVEACVPLRCQNLLKPAWSSLQNEIWRGWELESFF